jgi:hypothetical protein
MLNDEWAISWRGLCLVAAACAADAMRPDEVSIFGRRTGQSRAAAMVTIAADRADHYSTAASYPRQKGILPPTARPPSRIERRRRLPNDEPNPDSGFRIQDPGSGIQFVIRHSSFTKAANHRKRLFTASQFTTFHQAAR